MSTELKATVDQRPTETAHFEMAEYRSLEDAPSTVVRHRSSVALTHHSSLSTHH
jgi:hypothetical protein